MTDKQHLFGTGICTGDLGLLIAKLRELRVSHAKVGPVEVWLDHAPQPVQASVPMADVMAALAVAAGDEGDFTAEELEYVP